jgi:hypothetical protein
MFCDHLPLYRQSVIYEREGVELSRALLADWVGACGDLLAPLVDAIGRHVLTAGKLHADDTPLLVLAPGLGKTKTARLWTYVREGRPSGSQDPPAVCFAYKPDRKGAHPQQMKDFAGVLQADGFADFNALYESGGIQEAACWAHAQRKFYELEQARPSPITGEARGALARCMQSRKRSGANRSKKGFKYGKSKPGRCSRRWKCGCARRSPRYRANRIRRLPFCMRSIGGRR